MFELPEETDCWWNNEWTNSNEFRGFFERSERLIEIDNAIEDLRDELLHCSPHETIYIYEQLEDLERRKENIMRSL